MRDAEARKHWAKLESAGPGVLTKFEYADVPSLGSGHFSLTHPLAVLCGLNGAGKSFVLQALLQCLTDPNADYPQHLRSRLDGGRLRATLNWRGSTHHIEVDLDKSTWTPEGPHAAALGEDLPVEILDLPDLAPALQSAFRTEANLSELIETVEPLALTTDARRTLSALVGKDYSSVEIFELENFADRGAVPYARATSNGYSYGAETMGLGELSAFCLYWFLHRAQKGSILLFEEPESFLSPRSQAFVMDLIVRTCAEVGATAIVTTHSPFVLSRTRDDMVWVVLSSAMGVEIRDETNAAAHIEFVGLKPRMDFILFVEDRAATEFLRYLLGARSRAIGSRAEIVWCGSDEAVIQAANGIPPYTRVLRIASVLDGDVRDKNHQSRWPVLYLPSDAAPDAMFRELCISNPAAVASRLGVAQELFELALAEISGLDFHDWIDALCARLNGIQPSAAFAAIVGTWLEIEDNAEVCDRFIENLRVALTDGPEPARVPGRG